MRKKRKEKEPRATDGGDKDDTTHHYAAKCDTVEIALPKKKPQESASRGRSLVTRFLITEICCVSVAICRVFSVPLPARSPPSPALSCLPLPPLLACLHHPVPPLRPSLFTPPGPIHTSLALSHPLLLGPVSLQRMSDIAVRLCVCVCVPQGQVGQMGLRSQLMCAPAPRAPASPRARPRAFTRLCA